MENSDGSGEMHGAPQLANRVLLIDAQPVVRLGLRFLIERSRDFRVAAEAGTFAEAISRFRQSRPTLIVVDPALPDVTATEIFPRLRQEGIGLPTLVFTAYRDEWNVMEALTADIHGYLTKAASPDVVLEALRIVADGGHYLDPRIAFMVMGRVGSRGRDGRQGGPGCTLTARERDVLRLLAQGRRNREISESLHISERTVKFHMTALFQKLEAGNRTQAVRKAINYGLVHP